MHDGHAVAERLDIAPFPLYPYGDTDMTELKSKVFAWCGELGFQHAGITDIDLSQAESRLADWLRVKFHGSMDYMERHGSKRSRPDELVPGTLRVISVRMDYLPESQDAAKQRLDDGRSAYISRYALGRDYHKTLRGRLRALARHIEENIGEFGYRVFVDSAPVLEKALAEKSGIGWVGKHTNVIDRDTGSWFFLGELYTDLPLPVDAAEESHCGTCTACIDVCPTKAIVAPVTKLKSSLKISRNSNSSHGSTAFGRLPVSPTGFRSASIAPGVTPKRSANCCTDRFETVWPK